jgi:hypothetical protein
MTPEWRSRFPAMADALRGDIAAILAGKPLPMGRPAYLYEIIEDVLGEAAEPMTAKQIHFAMQKVRMTTQNSVEACLLDHFSDRRVKVGGLFRYRAAP